MIKIEIFTSPGCSKCGHARTTLQKMVEELGGDSFSWREVNILDELDYAVNLGVLSTPSIDGELCYTSLPSVKKLRQQLLERRG